MREAHQGDKLTKPTFKLQPNIPRNHDNVGNLMPHSASIFPQPKWHAGQKVGRRDGISISKWGVQFLLLVKPGTKIGDDRGWAYDWPRIDPLSQEATNNKAKSIRRGRVR